MPLNQDTLGAVQDAENLAEQIRAAFAVDTSDDDLKNLAAQPGGAAILDQMVAEIGPKANSEEKRRIVAKAMKARFDIDELSGDLSTRALPRLYGLLKNLPEGHVRDNDSLKRVERHRGSSEGASYYKESEQRIVLNVERTGPIMGALNFESYYPDGPDKSAVRVNSFDVTTLHEVGHAVDAEKQDYMGRNGGQAGKGEWATHSSNEIIEVALANYDMSADFPSYPRSYFRKYLMIMMGTGDPTTLNPKSQSNFYEFQNSSFRVQTLFNQPSDSGRKF